MHTRTWVRPLENDDLNKDHTTGKDVQFTCVCRGICQYLRRHVAIGSRAVGGHAKVGHLGSLAADQEDIVAAEVSVHTYEVCKFKVLIKPSSEVCMVVMGHHKIFLKVSSINMTKIYSSQRKLHNYPISIKFLAGKFAAFSFI